jgi:hypothetical protein
LLRAVLVKSRLRALKDRVFARTRPEGWPSINYNRYYQLAEFNDEVGSQMTMRTLEERIITFVRSFMRSQ